MQALLYPNCTHVKKKYYTTKYIYIYIYTNKYIYIYSNNFSLFELFSEAKTCKFLPDMLLNFTQYKRKKAIEFSGMQMETLELTESR